MTRNGFKYFRGRGSVYGNVEKPIRITLDMHRQGVIGLVFCLQSNYSFVNISSEPARSKSGPRSRNRRFGLITKDNV